MSGAPGAQYIISTTTLAVAANAPILEILGNTQEIGILSISGILIDATATDIGLIRSATVGTPKNTNNFTGQPEDGFSVTLGTIATDWTAAPTISGTPAWLERVPLVAMVGTFFEMTWSRESPLICLGDSSVLLWNYGAAAAGRIEVTVEWAKLPLFNQFRVG